ncbi:hypothetical protein K7432_004557 [Basidiobolus ranarum]|uniref:SET domain-containing protein n=1 Tax=Basidiobolus ranarum TaxID=34480 RepID=A0ABR2WY61_9FUNG
MTKARFAQTEAKELRVGSHSEGHVKRMLKSVPNGVYAFVFYVAVFFLIGRYLDPLSSTSSTQHVGIASEVTRLHQQTMLLQNEIFEMILKGKKIDTHGNADSRRFYMEDFEDYHQVVPIHTMLIDPAIERFVHAHDITTDEEYTEDAESIQTLALKYGAAITEGTRYDKRFYVRWVDDIRGYGLFTTVNIPSGAILGIYGGLLTNGSYTTDYMWNYKGEVLDDQGVKIDLGIDAKFYGNWFRFANHHDEPNSRGIYIPYNNKWHVIYVAESTILADTQVFVSYGSNYWTKRTKIL